MEDFEDLDIAILQNDIIRPNGAEIVSMMHARELDADLWCLRYDEDVFPEIAGEIDIYEYGRSLALDTAFSTTFNTIAPAFADPSFLEEYEVVICHQDLTEILAYRAKKKYGTKVIWYMHNTSDLLYRGYDMAIPVRTISWTLGFILRRLERRAFENMDRIFVNSELTMKERVIPDLGKSDKLEVLHPPIRHIEKTEKTEEYVAVLSRVARNKNLEKAIEEMQGREEKLRMAGTIKDEEYKRELEELAEDNGVQLEILGFIPDDELDEFISNAKFGIYTSEHETFGLVPLEMMSAGTPCFMQETIGAAEVIPDELHVPISDEIPEPLSIEELNQDHYSRLKEAIRE